MRHTISQRQFPFLPAGNTVIHKTNQMTSAEMIHVQNKSVLPVPPRYGLAHDIHMIAFV